VLSKADYEGIGERLQDLREEMSTLESCMVKNKVLLLNWSLVGIGSFWLASVGLDLQTMTMHVSMPLSTRHTKFLLLSQERSKLNYEDA